MNVDRRGLGIALGYPISSVEAFMEGQTVAGTDTPEVDPRLRAFCPFMPSISNYKEELELASSWLDKIGQLSPKI